MGFRRSLYRALIVLSVTAITATPAKAVVVAYENDQAGWLAASGSVNTIDFESFTGQLITGNEFSGNPGAPNFALQSGTSMTSDGAISDFVPTSGSNTFYTTTSGTVANGVISNFEDVIIDTGSNVSLKGALDADVAVNSGATVSAGNSPGLLNIVGNLDLGVSSTTLFELAGLTPGVEVGGYDVIDVADDPGTGGTTEGVATIAGGAIFDIDFFAGFMAGLGDTFDVLVADAISVVDFDLLVFDFTDAVLAANLGWSKSLHDLGNGRSSVRIEVVSSQVPEPGTLIVFGFGLLGFGFVSRRRP